VHLTHKAPTHHKHNIIDGMHDLESRSRNTFSARANPPHKERNGRRTANQGLKAAC